MVAAVSGIASQVYALSFPVLSSHPLLESSVTTEEFIINNHNYNIITWMLSFVHDKLLQM